MSTLGSPYVWIYDSPGRGALLLRGEPTQRVLRAAHLDNVARWSISGHGHVVSRVHLADLLAAAEHVGILCRVKEVAP